MLLDYPIAASAHSATVESAERNHCGRMLYGGDKWSMGSERKDGKRQRREVMFFFSRASWAPAWPGLIQKMHSIWLDLYWLVRDFG